MQEFFVLPRCSEQINAERYPQRNDRSFTPARQEATL